MIDVPPGMVVWFTGLPASGKTTLALAVRDRLRLMGRSCLLLDSDEVRRRIAPQLGYDQCGRSQFYELLARLAGWLADQGQTVLVAATANLRSYRARARELAPYYYEVFVNTAVEACAKRDPKGLYRAAGQAADSALPGVGASYEPPLQPDIVATGGRDQRSIQAIVQACRKQNWAAKQLAGRS